MSVQGSNELVSLGILASAGTGKTYQLSQRYLALLALGEDAGASAGSMIALTFTRKAAREFAQRIVSSLALAAAHEHEAAALAKRLEQVWHGTQTDPQFGSLPALVKGEANLPRLSQGFFVHLLGQFVAQLDKLQLTTLDSFFTHLARTCAYELGMAGFRLLEEPALQAAQERVLAEIFEQRGESKQFALMEQAMLRSLAGREELRWKRHLQEMLRDGLGLWWEFSRVEWWGNFVHGYQILTEIECQACLQCIEDLLDADGVKFEKEGKREQNARNSLWGYAKWLAAAGAGAKQDGGSLGRRLREEGLELGKEAIHMSYHNKAVQISQQVGVEFRRLMEHFLATELAQIQLRSRGFGELLAEVDDLYAKRVRSRGEVSFAEMGALLAGLPLLPQREPFELIALDWQARLDASLEHWFLDEFQDTSRLQWRVLEDTLDELVLEQGGRRSLFLVGDPKQAIYGWRGGDDRLFGELWQKDGWGEELAHWGMAQSFRSAPAVLEMVNRVFTKPQWGQFEAVPQGLAERWEFTEHASALEGVAGQACLWELVGEEGGTSNALAAKAEDEEQSAEIAAVWRACAELIFEAEVERRQISVAILVRKGQTALEGGEALRRLFALAGVELAVEVEGEAALSQDSPLGLLLADLFGWLALPADRFAWRHLCMSPLAELIAEWGGEEGFWQQLWQRWQRGLAVEVLEFLQPVWAKLALGEYQLQRWGDWFSLARKWQQQGGGTLANWRQVLAESRQREYATGSAVQVMTVHKAKGLEWDMVILAELGERLQWTDLSRMETLSGWRERAGVEEGFVLKRPSKLLLEWEPELRARAETWQQQQAYEALCVNYVALTRAQKAVHLLLPPVGKTLAKKVAQGGAVDLPLRSDSWMRLACGELFEGREEANAVGDSAKSLLWEAGSSSASWVKDCALREQRVLAADKTWALGVARSPRRRRRQASQEGGVMRSGAAMEGVAYGTAVHQWAAQLPLWGEKFPLELQEMAGGETGAELSVKARAAEAVFWAWRDVELPWAWGGDVAGSGDTGGDAWELWTERGFEILEAEEWISGVFDRVMLQRDEGDELREVRLLEIKTDAVEEAAELVRRHREQLSLYQRVLGRLLGIEPQRIEAKFLWLPAGGEARLVDLLES